MAVEDRVSTLIAPLLAHGELELFDVEQAGGVLRILVDRPGGVDVDALTDLARQVSVLFDDADPLPGRYTLEVSSPGLERRLRTKEHFEAAIGEHVTVRTAPGDNGRRRITGELQTVTDKGVTVANELVAFDEIDKARTVFEWGPAKSTTRTDR